MFGLRQATPTTPEAARAVEEAQSWANQLQKRMSLVEVDSALGPGERIPIGDYDLVETASVPANVDVFYTVEPEFFALNNMRMWYVAMGLGGLAVVGGGTWFLLRKRR